MVFEHTPQEVADDLLMCYKCSNRTGRCVLCKNFNLYLDEEKHPVRGRRVCVSCSGLIHAASLEELNQEAINHLLRYCVSRVQRRPWPMPDMQDDQVDTAKYSLSQTSGYAFNYGVPGDFINLSGVL